MFVPAMMRKGPGLRGQGPNGQPITEQPWHRLCSCGCHPPQKPPLAIEARLCQECADERFISWQQLVEVMMRG